MEAEFSLASLTDIKLDATCPTNAKYTFPNAVPSLNSIEMTEVTLAASLSAVTLGFTMGTKIQIATGSATCAADTLATDAKCLLATVSAGLTLTPISMTFSVSTAVDGVWFDPLGLRNFALANPALAVDLKVTPTISYFKKVSWAAALYWKRPAMSAWHSTLLDRSKSDDTSGLLTLASTVVYQQTPHSDVALNTLRLPMFGVKLVLTQMTMTVPHHPI
jgi:hypothetical protein